MQDSKAENIYGSPEFPILIIPGLCSSALKVEAGYDKWLNKRIWLSISLMGKERLRLNSTSKLTKNFFDPGNPPITSGFLYKREGTIFNREWNKYFFTFSVEKKTLFWFNPSDTWELTNTDSPSNSIPKTVINPDAIPVDFINFTNSSTTVNLVHKSPVWTTFDFSIIIKSSHKSVIICSDSEDVTLWRFDELQELINHMHPSKATIKNFHTNSKNLWLDHLNLMEDGISDPIGIRIRPEKGLNAVNYLEGNPVFRSLSYVFAPVINKLKSIGYTKKYIYAVPYDWRLPPYLLQSRDAYFSRVKNKIEKIVGTTGKPVILLAHSLGNLVTQYFFQFLIRLYPNALQWIHQHIHMFFALGAPWLGAPKSLRGLCVGDKMGLDAFLSMSEAINFSRRMGSAPWLFPAKPELHFEDPKQQFAMLNINGELFQKSHEEMLNIAGAEQSWNMYLNYYDTDPLLNNNRQFKAPPVPWLVCVYGINIETEVSFIATNKPQKGSNITLDKTVQHGYYCTKAGILLETPSTKQVILEKYAPNEDPHRCGDGTVPYASLRYAEIWKEEGRHVDIIEIPGAMHREILEDPIFLDTLLKCATNTYESPKTENKNTNNNINIPSYLTDIPFTKY